MSEFVSLPTSASTVTLDLTPKPSPKAPGAAPNPALEPIRDLEVPNEPPFSPASPEPVPGPALKVMEVGKLPALIRELYDSRQGKKTSTGYSYGRWGQQFLDHLNQAGWDFGSMPENCVSAWIESRGGSGAVRSTTMYGIRAFLTFAESHGFQVKPQIYQKIPKDRKAKVTEMPASIPAPVPAPETNGSPLGKNGHQASPFDLTTEDPFGASTPQVPQAAPEPKPAPSPKPQVRQVAINPSNLLPAGGRYKVSRKATSWDANIPPGSLINVGVYPRATIASAGSVEQFIQQSVVPVYGPRPGGPDTVYTVDHIDDRGNVTTSWELPFAAPLGSASGPIQGANGIGYGQSPFGAPAPQVQQAQSAPVSNNDKFLEYILEEKRSREKKFEEQLEALKKTNADPITLMMLAEKFKPAPIDTRAMIDDYRRMSGEVFAPQAQAPTAPIFSVPPPGNGIGDLFGSEPQRAPSPFEEAAAEVLKSLVASQAHAQNTPAVNPLSGIREIVELIKAIAPPPAPVGESALMVRLQMQLEQLARENQKLVEELRRPPEKSKNVAETLGDVISMFTALEKVKAIATPPSESPGTLQMILENAEGIAEGIAKVMSAVPRQAPILAALRPAGSAPALGPAPGTAPASQVAPLVLPEAAKAALTTLQDAALAPATPESEQALTDALFAYLNTLQTAPDPWPKYVRLVLSGFANVDSKPEIRALVTNLFARAGEKQLAGNVIVIERCTEVIHKYYTGLYKTLTGQDKVLKDAVVDAKAKESEEEENEENEENEEAKPGEPSEN